MSHRGAGVFLAVGAIVFAIGCEPAERADPGAASDEANGVAPPGARAGAEGDAPLGTAHLPVSCDGAVQEEFDRGVALLHHMTYPQARQTFERVAAADPECAMAHWGIAMTLFQPMWPTRPGPEALARGWREVEQALALAPPTPRESLYVATTEAFFRDPEAGDYRTRIARWERAAEALHRAHPEDREAAALYALAHLATAPTSGGSLAHHERAGEILLGIYRQEPTHAGAIHYTIHANDVTGRERESLEIVRSYGAIAPHNPHALHMPTHIFVRLGEWEDAIEWNRRAAAAALDHPAGPEGEYVSSEYTHASAYLVYAYLQRGDDAAAEEALLRVRTTPNLEPDFKAAFDLASLPARYALERRAWDEAAALPPRSPESVAWDRFAWPEAVTWFARALGSARLGDPGAARGAVQKLGELRERAAAEGEAAFAREIEILDTEAAAWAAHAGGEDEQALRLMREAVELEASTPKQPVTPAPLLPARELLGDLLMELERPGEALAAYEAALDATPGRLNALLGAARAADAAGEPEKARRFRRTIVDGTAGDSPRPGVVEVRERIDARAGD